MVSCFIEMYILLPYFSQNPLAASYILQSTSQSLPNGPRALPHLVGHVTHSLQIMSPPSNFTLLALLQPCQAWSGLGVLALIGPST